MPQLNSRFSARTAKLGFVFPEVLMPAPAVDPAKWAVIACDQHTSDTDYWNAVEETVGTSPSTLRLTLPEIHLEAPDVEDRISAIHKAMNDYLASGTVKSIGETLIYIERTTSASGLRQGILLAVDLEAYNFAVDSTSLIRATEGTILERIPPRVRIRKGAALELPHIMILIDDKTQTIIESLVNRHDRFRELYDIDLMLEGGNLKGFAIEDEGIVEEIIKGLEGLASLAYAKRNFGSDSPFLFAMGDGNHSLATAKTVWEEMKSREIERSGTWDAIASHPARYALAEIVNLHSPGLRFEPIHRVVFNADPQGLRTILENSFGARYEQVAEAKAREVLEKTPDGQRCAATLIGDHFHIIKFPAAEKRLPNALIDEAFKQYRTSSPSAAIDFVHGWEHTKKAASKVDSSPFFCPVLSRDSLFGYVAKQGPLPRKAFSMGDAEEKRYYVESRRILS